MWHVQRGDLVRAEGNLERIKVLCGGTGCTAYKELANAITSQPRQGAN
jgi:hypothetical protein